MKKYSELALLGGLLLLAGIVFFRIVHFEFVHWDDNVFISENGLLSLPPLQAVKQAFGSLFAGDYLPVTLLSFWADSQVMGRPDPEVSHAVNLALHLINILLVWFCACGIFRDRRIVFFIGLIFAIHPLQVESVAWISERKGLLCAGFTLLAILCAERADRGRWLRLGYPLLFLLALLSKASTIFTPVLLLGYDHWVHGRQWRQSLRKHSLAMTFAVLFILIRIFAYSQSATQFSHFMWDPHRWLTVPVSALNALGFYFSKFFWPTDLSIIYPLFEINTVTWIHLLMMTFVGVLSWLQWRQRRNPVLLLSLLWVLLYFLPILQIVPRLNYVNDRYTYFPLIGMAAWTALTVQWIFSAWPSRVLNGAVTTGFLLLSIGLVALSWGQASIWETDLTLWRDTSVKRPWSGIAHLNFGGALESHGDIPQAISEYTAAAHVDPLQDVIAQAYGQLALVYSKPEYPAYFNLVTAADYMNQALQQPIDEGSRYTLRYNLAHLKAMAGETEEARKLCRDLLADLAKNPDSAHNHVREFTENLLRKL